ncbi:MAG: hypothetical protein ACYDH0_09170 [Candidatus Aminicenantales bacterium]
MEKTIFVLFLSLFSTSLLYPQKSLVRWTEPDAKTYVKSTHSSVVFNVADGVLGIKTIEKGANSLSIDIPEGSRDVSKNVGIQIPVANAGNAECRVSARLNGKKWVGGAVVLAPGESENLEILFLHPVDKTAPPFANMDGVPGGGLYIWDPVDPSDLKTIQIEIKGDGPVSITIGGINADGDYRTGKEAATDEGFFPFIDEYGQYKHHDWPGKIHSDKDLEKNLLNERKELLLLAEPGNFDKYGGWEDGPKLPATGNFYVEKVNGAWWLIDPEGKLFWSHGVNCAGFGSGGTQTAGREEYFAKLPGTESPFNFYTANLARKFGDDWRGTSILHIHRRLRSWGMNTIANWSEPAVYLSEVKRTPYTVNISYRSPALDGASYKFPDVFDPQFKESLETGVKRAVETTHDDSWCIGYFIDNELYLGDYDRLPAIIMKQKPEGAGKKAFFEYLRKEYITIGNFNGKYKTRFGSWKDLSKETSLPEAALKDVESFNRVIIAKYYSICRAAIKELAPRKLYLGNRFNLYRIYYPEDALINDALKKAAEYCDVVSINYYRFGCEDLILPDGIDRPIIIGEFHFGALDRGLPHTGLRNVANQEQRAAFYRYYLNQALKNPQIIGTHWFQYGDEPYTGRFDGENYQIGFVDVCDTPYPETIKAVRNIGYNMYVFRSNK